MMKSLITYSFKGFVLIYLYSKFKNIFGPLWLYFDTNDILYPFLNLTLKIGTYDCQASKKINKRITSVNTRLVLVGSVFPCLDYIIHWFTVRVSMVSAFEMWNNYDLHSEKQYSAGTWILKQSALSCILHYILRSAFHQLPSSTYHQIKYISTYNMCMYMNLDLSRKKLITSI